MSRSMRDPQCLTFHSCAWLNIHLLFLFRREVSFAGRGGVWEPCIEDGAFPVVPPPAHAQIQRAPVLQRRLSKLTTRRISKLKIHTGSRPMTPAFEDTHSSVLCSGGSVSSRRVSARCPKRSDLHSTPSSAYQTQKCGSFEMTAHVYLSILERRFRYRRM